jgi:hypothetical protein
MISGHNDYCQNIGNFRIRGSAAAKRIPGKTSAPPGVFRSLGGESSADPGQVVGISQIN